jgi:cytochrome c-type biogenesis protein CcmF
LVLVAVVVVGDRSAPSLVALPVAAAAAATALYEFARVVVRRRPRLLVVQRRRYGAYLAHLGLVVIAVGVAASHFGQQERDVTLRPGEQVTVAGYTLQYMGQTQRDLGDHVERVAAMRFGDQTLEPSRATYAGLGGQALTHVAITTTPVADVYVSLDAANDDGSASFSVYVNPLVTWIWAGGALLILGVVLGNVGERRLAAELSRRRVRATLPA